MVGSSPQQQQEQQQHPSVLPQHSPLCSAFAGALRSGGNAVLGSEGIEVFKHRLDVGLQGKQKTPPSKAPTTSPAMAAKILPSSLATISRATIPGFFAFETHHAVASSLLGLRSTAETPLGSLASHTLHFVAGGAGGLSYGLALAVLGGGGGGAQTFVPKILLRHVLSHGALFGGYDCFSDINALLFQNSEYLEVGIAGGEAGIIQHIVGRQLSGTALTLRPALLAFPPGALAFLAYNYTAALLDGGGGGGHH